jgi:hypothetical protein
MTNSHISEERPEQVPSIREALEKALKNPVHHGTFTLVLTYRDAKVVRFITSWEESHLVCSTNAD